METKENLLEIITFILSIMAIILIGFVLKPMRAIMVPIFISIFIFMLFKPLLMFLKKKKVPKVLAVIVTLVVLILVMQTLGMIVYASLSSFVKEFPSYEQKLSDLYFETIQRFNLTHEEVKQFDWESQISTVSITKIVGGLFGSILDFVTKFFLILLILLYLLFSEGSFVKKARYIFREENGETMNEVVDMIQRINHQVYSYLITKTIISLLTGAGAAIILKLYGVDFPIVWGVLTFLLNYIPNFGSLIATFFPFTISIVQFGEISRPFWILITLSSLQITMGNIVEPKLVSENLDMSPVAVIVSLIFWGWLWGIQGMFIGVPITAIIKIICENIPSLRFIAVIMSNK